MKSGRKILVVVTLLLLAGFTYALYVWNKPHRDVSDEQAISTTATAIFDSFSVNTNRANQLFLNKAIEVTGEVSEFKTNQAGQAVVYLKTSDPIFGVNCTFKENPGSLSKGTTITFKGICTGFLEDVVINQGVIVNK